MSHNQIEKFDGLQGCVKLQVFFATNNRVKQWDEVAKLASLNELKSVLLSGNPIYGDRANEENHPLVVKRVP